MNTVLKKAWNNCKDHYIKKVEERVIDKLRKDKDKKKK